MRAAWLLLLLAACGPHVDHAEGLETVSSTGPEDAESSTSVGSTSSDSTTDVSDSSTSASGGGIAETFFEPDDLRQAACDVIEQDCPGGQKCVPVDFDEDAVPHSTACVPIAPHPSLPGETCTVVDARWGGTDDCDGTSMCWAVDPETLTGTCVAFCVVDDASRRTCAAADSICVNEHDGLLPLCLPCCDTRAHGCDGEVTCERSETTG